MVGAVKRWQKSDPAKAQETWRKLSEANSKLEIQFNILSKLAEENWNAYKCVLDICSKQRSEKVFVGLVSVISKKRALLKPWQLSIDCQTGYMHLWTLILSGIMSRKLCCLWNSSEWNFLIFYFYLIFTIHVEFPFLMKGHLLLLSSSHVVGILWKTGTGNLWFSYVLRHASVNFILKNIHFKLNKALNESLSHCQHLNHELPEQEIWFPSFGFGGRGVFAVGQWFIIYLNFTWHKQIDKYRAGVWIFLGSSIKVLAFSALLFSSSSFMVVEV